MALLVLTSITVPLASLPLLPVLKTHVIAALAASHADAWTTDTWWNRPYSWILCGGPPGRWIVGILLGFRVLREHRIPEPSWLSGHLIAQPHARLTILAAAATLIWLFAVVRIVFFFSFLCRIYTYNLGEMTYPELMLVTFLQAMTVVVASDVTKGQSTLDSVRVREPRAGQSARTSTGRFVCVPYSEKTLESFATTSAVREIHTVPRNSPNTRRRIYPIPIEERVYDLGWRENWRRVLEQPLFDRGAPCRGSVVQASLARISLTKPSQRLPVVENEPNDASAHACV